MFELARAGACPWQWPLLTTSGHPDRRRRPGGFRPPATPGHGRGAVRARRHAALKDAIADVLEAASGRLHRPAQNVYDAVLDLYGRGEAADAVTVAAELDRRGLLKRIGGAPICTPWSPPVPTAASAGYYAGIVARRRCCAVWWRRAPGWCSTAARALGRRWPRWSTAQAEIYEVTDRRTSGTSVPLRICCSPRWTRSTPSPPTAASLAAYPPGSPELDELTNGLHAGQMIIVAARPGVGKALALDPCRRPPAEFTMGDVGVGDCCSTGQGFPTRSSPPPM